MNKQSYYMMSYKLYEHHMEFLFDKIGNKRTLSQLIEHKIEGAIREKKLVPGQKLPPEKQMCEMFGVSRTALREALQMLSTRGLITIKKGSGVYINNFSHEHASKQISLYLDLSFDKNYVLHLARVRQLVEPQNARLAAMNRSEEQLRALKENLTHFTDPEQTPEVLAKCDVEFHTNIARATGNPIIPIMMDPVFSLFTKVKTLIVKDLNIRGQDSYNYHKVIYEMIEKQDADGAFHAMVDHLNHAEHDMYLLFKHLDESHN